MTTFKNTKQFPTTYFPDLLRRIYGADPEIMKLYPNAGMTADFSKQIHTKSDFPSKTREILANVLRKQYNGIAKAPVFENIQKLENQHTFTVTTGQQIHVFLGPLYVIYKALTTLNLANQLSKNHPDKQFVPVFWMATEDHDFDEIRGTTLFGKKFNWNAQEGGPVGRLDTSGIDTMISEMRLSFPNDVKVSEALDFFQSVYKKCHTLAEATRFLLNEFFGEKGLVVIDPDDVELKKLCIPLFKEDITTKNSEDGIAKASLKLKELGLNTAIPARSPNLFVLEDGARRRLDFNGIQYELKGSEAQYSEKEIIEKLEQSPADFSPNVALRPIMQEIILPNLAYIAGPGEINYWFQLGETFEKFDTPRPVLYPRHSFIFPDGKSYKWLTDKGMDWEDLLFTESQLKQIFFKESIKKSPIPDAKNTVELKFEEIYKFLYEVRSDKLKEIKKSGEAMLKLLEKTQDEFIASLATNDLHQKDWEKLMKIKLKYFDTDSPQERTSHFLENWVQNKLFLSNFEVLPDMKISPLSLGLSD